MHWSACCCFAVSACCRAGSFSNLFQFCAYNLSDFLYTLSVSPLALDVGTPYVPAYTERLFATLLSCSGVKRLTFFGLRKVKVCSVGSYNLFLNARPVYLLAYGATSLASEPGFVIPNRPPAKLHIPSRRLPERGIVSARHLSEHLRFAPRRYLFFCRYSPYVLGNNNSVVPQCTGTKSIDDAKQRRYSYAR